MVTALNLYHAEEIMMENKIKKKTVLVTCTNTCMFGPDRLIKLFITVLLNCLHMQQKNQTALVSDLKASLEDTKHLSKYIILKKELTWCYYLIVTM